VGVKIFSECDPISFSSSKSRLYPVYPLAVRL
jgi:hypothetical protein